MSEWDGIENILGNKWNGDFLIFFKPKSSRMKCFPHVPSMSFCFGHLHLCIAHGPAFGMVALAHGPTCLGNSPIEFVS